MHVCNCCFGIGFGCVQNVCSSTVGIDWLISQGACKLQRVLTVPVDWHVQVPDLTVRAKDLAEMVFVDIFRELLNHDLGDLA